MFGGVQTQKILQQQHKKTQQEYQLGVTEIMNYIRNAKKLGVRLKSNFNGRISNCKTKLTKTLFYFLHVQHCKYKKIKGGTENNWQFFWHIGNIKDFYPKLYYLAIYFSSNFNIWPEQSSNRRLIDISTKIQARRVFQSNCT